MSLENLLKTKQLQPHNPTREAVQRLLQAAARNIADAQVKKISGENRFDAAYKAIMQYAMVALWANRYRTSTSKLRHPFAAPVNDPTHEEFWALKDVSFYIQQGDRVSIIGRNGATRADQKHRFRN